MASMLLTRAADYGVRVMIHLAKLPKGKRASLPMLAESAQVPKSFLSKVLQMLTHSGLILSWRGNDGGFEILPAGMQATVRTVIEAVDGPLFLNVCLTSGKACERQHHCPGHAVWVNAQRAVMEVLEGATIATLAAVPDPPAPKLVKPKSKLCAAKTLVEIT
jgi:Rrf2 family protein